mmetsp:Transcript_44012/g.42598  ORF Transcript_44012/g.42598 Transcript_44012/m.42598 type:complete len:185 (-) Transcript_44012:303-857(-)
MYGTAMPVLYPIALLTYIILYITERCLVFYYYKQPPAFDQKMTNTSLNILRWGPFLLFAMTYWILGNNQVFDNQVFVQEYTSNITFSGHSVIKDLSDYQFDQSMPCFFMAVLLLVCIPFGSLITSCLNACTGGSFEIKLNIDENLERYYDALDEDDKKFTVLEEENMRNNYKVKTLLDQNFLNF